MNPAPGMVITGVLVTAGQWSQNKPVTPRVVVGATVLTIGLAVLAESSPELAGKFTNLIVLTAVFAYGPAILWKVGLLDHAKYKTPPKW